MYGGFFTSHQHRKKTTLEFGIKKASQCQENFISTIWQKKFSTLCFGIVEEYCPLISKKVEIKLEWIPKHTWQF